MPDCRGVPASGGGEALPQGALTRLDHATKLVRERREMWVLTVYPDAGEAGGSWVWVGRGMPPCESLVPDPERAKTEADRRARGKLRRYVAANRLNRLVTLTYAEANHDPHLLRTHMSKFVRKLRRETDVETFPYLWVPEWHKSGHGLHAHVAVGSFIPKRLIEESWGHGFVDVRLIRSRHVRGALNQSRAAAGYLAKYVGKDLARKRESGLHRYEVAQGFQPRSYQTVGTTWFEVFADAHRTMKELGLQLAHSWHSRNEENWQGPPATWIQWRDRIDWREL